MKKWFEPNKNSKELGIDISKRFVLLTPFNEMNIWDIWEITDDDDSDCPEFRNISTLQTLYIRWKYLAYADNTARKTPKTSYQWEAKRNDWVVFTKDSIKENGEFISIEKINEEKESLKERIKQINSLLASHRNLFKK